jgi:hypothetical protein
MSFTDIATSNGAVIFSDHEVCASATDNPPTTKTKPKLANTNKIDLSITRYLRLLDLRTPSFHPPFVLNLYAEFCLPLNHYGELSLFTRPKNRSSSP